MATQDYTGNADEITPRPRTLPLGNPPRESTFAEVGMSLFSWRHSSRSKFRLAVDRKLTPSNPEVDNGTFTLKPATLRQRNTKSQQLSVWAPSGPLRCSSAYLPLLLHCPYRGTRTDCRKRRDRPQLGRRRSGPRCGQTEWPLSWLHCSVAIELAKAGGLLHERRSRLYSGRFGLGPD